VFLKFEWKSYRTEKYLFKNENLKEITDYMNQYYS
jgi:hypothetical protein